MASQNSSRCSGARRKLLLVSVYSLETKVESKGATEIKQLGEITLGRNPSLSAFPFVLLLCTDVFSWGVLSTGRGVLS